MKTINEAAKECEFHSIGNQSHFTPEQIFRYGVAFAEQWIQVEDELPENEQDIICKNDTYYECLRYYKTGFKDGDYLKCHFTHWRPIERTL